MIKDNHRVILARLGPPALGDAVTRARHAHPHIPVIIEADTLDQVGEALAAGAEHVLLDNMSLDDLRRAVAMARGRAITEASGRITPDTAAAVAATGVDQIAVGWLTHSAKVLDIGLDA